MFVFGSASCNGYKRQLSQTLFPVPHLISFPYPIPPQNQSKSSSKVSSRFQAYFLYILHISYISYILALDISTYYLQDPSFHPRHYLIIHQRLLNGVDIISPSDVLLQLPPRITNKHITHRDLSPNPASSYSTTALSRNAQPPS